MDTIDLSETVNDQVAWYERLLNQAVTRDVCIGKGLDLRLNSSTSPHIDGIISALNQLKQALS